MRTATAGPAGALIGGDDWRTGGRRVAQRRMVTLVRDAQGWSQHILADRAGLSQGFISKVENGLLELQDGPLERVASALGCPVALLCDSTALRGLEVTCLHHRRRSSKLSATAVRQVEAVTNLTRISVEGLLHGVDLLPETRLVPMDIDEVGDAAHVARQLRSSWRVPSGPVHNLTALLEAAGVVVVQRELGSNAQDAVSSWPREHDRPPVMLINAGLAPDRYRFTLAHELGHLVMHRLPSDTQEKEANLFAAEFLAPGDEIGEALTDLTTRDLARLLALKQEWGLSIAALMQRALDLDKITDRQFREMRVQLGRLGWRDIEPGSVPPESPTTLAHVIDLHREGHDSDTDLAARAGMTESAFRRHYLPAPSRDAAVTLRLTHDQDRS